jgi:hypothetical protein
MIGFSLSSSKDGLMFLSIRRCLAVAALVSLTAPAGAATTGAGRHVLGSARAKIVSPFGARFSRGIHPGVVRHPKVAACTTIPNSGLTLPAGDTWDVTPQTAVYYDTIPPTGSVVDATGCDVGIFLDSAGPVAPTISGNTIHDANLYGILVNQLANVTVTGVTVSNTGTHANGVYAPNGVQIGVGIDYEGGSGSVNSVTVSNYQKNGTAFDYGASVGINNSLVTGAGAVNYIAQNGIQWYNATVLPSVGNIVTGDHYYNPSDTTYNYGATGILVLCTNISASTHAGAVALHQLLTRNRATDNDYNIYADNTGCAI